MGLVGGMAVEEVIGGVRHTGNLPNKGSVGRWRLAGGRVDALDEGRVGEDARAVGELLHCREAQPWDGVRVYDDSSQGRQGSDYFAAAVAPPRWPGKMVGHDVAVVVKQSCPGHRRSPSGAIPGVNLKAHAEAVEVNLIVGVHCDRIRDFGSTVISSQGGRSECAESS